MSLSDNDVPVENSSALVDLDALFQDTWLFVLSVKNHPVIAVDDVLYRRCSALVKEAQKRVQGSARADEIIFAQCALLDETVMKQTDTDVSAWHHNAPLQSRFFARLDGGDIIPERIKALLREPAPPSLLVGFYLRILQLGFCGLYRQETDPQRLELISKLQRLIPAASEQSPDTVRVVGVRSRLHALTSPGLLMSAALLMVFLGWLVLHAALVAQLTPAVAG